jgi:hypothetical protein
MSDDGSTIRSPRVSARATVTDLATRRRSDDVLRSITLLFGGVNYGTFPIAAPYVRGKPFALYVVSGDERDGDADLSGSLECLVTDDVTLAAELRAAQ